MKFDHYIDELYLIRNTIFKKNIREFSDGYDKFRYVPVAHVNRFVKVVITSIIGGLYINVANSIKKKIEQNKSDEKAVLALKELLEEFGEPNTSGLRFDKEQRQL